MEPLGFTLNSPRDVRQRGSHVSLGHPEGLRIDLALLAENILPDFRVPDNIRLGLAPLYISFHDIYITITRLQQIVEQRLYEKYSTEIPIVT